MDTVLLFSILVLLAVVMVLMLMVVDHVRAVHQAVAPPMPAEDDLRETFTPALEAPEGEEAPVDEKAEAQADAQVAQEDKADASFGNLQGKRLWDGMTGKPVEGVEPEKIEELKPRFGVILTKHIQELVAEGAEHGKAGSSKIASNRRKIKGLRGVVSSWIPQQHADAIYQAGFDSATVTEKNLESVRKGLEDVCDILFQRTGVDAKGAAWAQRLINLPGQAPAEAGDAGGDVPALGMDASAAAPSLDLQVPAKAAA
jgi:hypothetical protein